MHTSYVLALCVAILLVVAGWLLAIYHFRPADTPVSQLVPQAADTAVLIPAPPARGIAAAEDGWFADVTDLTGIDFRHQSGTSPEKPFPAANGSGVAALDFDLDGLSDLYFATGTPFPLDAPRTTPINRCYRNLGEWRMVDVTEHCGLGHDGYSAGIAVGDYDSDGFPDVYVNCYGANRLYRNQGDGTFQRAGQAEDERWGTSAAFLDYDGDGLLDLYACNYAKWTWETNVFCGDRGRNIRIYCSPQSVEPEEDILYRNTGDGTFADVSSPTGVAERAGRAQGVVAADLNGDGQIDLYVGNDLHANSLFLNNGDGTFRDATELSGVAYDYLGNRQAGMGVDAADVNGDGRLDLFVTNFQGEHNALYVSGGPELFHEVSHRLGLAAESLPWVGWGTALADFDLDGWPDVVVTNGHVDDNRHLLGQDAPYAEPPLAWRNTHGRFEPLGIRAGAYFAAPHVGRGLALADLDNDGDYDLVIGHQDAPPAVLRNNRLARSLPGDGPLVLRLIGTQSNRDAVGSTITIRTGQRTVVRQVKGGGSYLSAHDLRQVFAVEAGQPMELEIRWPGGRRSTVGNLNSGGRFALIEPLDGDTPRMEPLGP